MIERRIYRHRLSRLFCAALCVGVGLSASVGAAAADEDDSGNIGQIKVSQGQVSIERGGQAMAAPIGLRLRAADVLKTGADGSVGVTMRDNSLLSAGPNSIVSLARFEFDASTSQGRFEADLQRGTLAVVSGRIAKQSPASMSVRTPSAVLGVRGTNFVVSAEP
ncbi:MAG: FecR domain-containing protein [Rubrivivax sp.]